MEQPSDYFTDYEVFPDETSVRKMLHSSGLLETDKSHKGLIKDYFQACIDNIQKRKYYDLFRGRLVYFAELQNVFSYFRLLAPTFRQAFEQYIWNTSKVHFSKFDAQVQCAKCGDFTTPFLISCTLCLNAFYCSETCYTKDKHDHIASTCKRNVCPTMSGGLPLQVHVGVHLYEGVEVRFHHDDRMSFKIKGKKAVARLNELISSSGDLQRLREVKEQSIVINSMQDIQSVYLSNPALVVLRLILLKEGCIFRRVERRTEPEAVHLVLHYLYPI